MTKAYEPICLGGFCEAKFQIIRHMYFKEFPAKTPLSPFTLVRPGQMVTQSATPLPPALPAKEKSGLSGLFGQES